MTYFVTGATGFIGRNLVERLLGRDGDIYVLVRPGSVDRLQHLIERWSESSPGARERVVPVVGDLGEAQLGLSKQIQTKLRRAGVEHFFHLAAIYDMTAGEEANHLANVEGTQHAIQLANTIKVGCLHHVSSIAVAGLYRGIFGEEMFDQGQELDHPYHRTKFEAERLVRTAASVPWRVYRPSIVVGDSRTGEIDKVDGPYYFFSLVKRASHLLPEWLPLIGPQLGYTNIVPVDFVADALDHIAHEPDLDGHAFHLTDPNPLRATELLNDLARVAGGPRVAAIRLEPGALAEVPKRAAGLLMAVPGAHTARRLALGELGVPDEIVEYISLTARFDTTEARAALAGSGIEVPPFSSYVDRLWEYWEHHLDPDLAKPPNYERAIRGKTVLITGASSGIGKATALKVARAGGTPILIARGVEKLEETRREIEHEGGVAYTYAADISDPDSVDRLLEQLLAEHPTIDVLVNNAGRSIRRSIALSYDRFHDFERTIQLNYLGTIRLIMGLLPGMRERRCGHVINISSIGVQTNPPRFSAYVASKSALDAWTRVVSSECISDNVHFTTIHMPLVRTPMVAPTKMYDRFPMISADQAADMICEAIRTRPKTVGTKLGTFGEVSYALFPRLVDQVLSTAYKVFPDSAAARGYKDPTEKASTEQLALARILKGIHW